MIKRLWTFACRWQWVVWLGLAIWQVARGDAVAAGIWGVIAGIEMTNFELAPKPTRNEVRIGLTAVEAEEVRELIADGAPFEVGAVVGHRADVSLTEKAYGGTD